MAFAYTVNELRDGRRITFSGRDDKLKIVWTTQYAVEVTASGGDDVKDVSPVDVVRQTGLPLVNRSVYYFNGKIIPYLICRNKEAAQNKDKLSRWIVSCRYETSDPTDRHESQELEQDPPATIDDITPRVEVVLEESERVLYTDKTTPAAKAILTPTGNFYAQPAVERIPILVLKITQYEGFIAFEEMLERRFKCNSTTYRSKGPYLWFVEDVDAIDAKLQLASGEVDVAQVTYTVKYNPMLDADGVELGWKEERALIDTHHIEGGKKKPIVDDLAKTETIGYIDINGAWLPNATEPDYDEFKFYNTIDFNSFLKT